MSALLDAAHRHHLAHGVIGGLNFVECAMCCLHVHLDPMTGDKLWKHWREPESFDRRPITSADDERLR